MTEYHLSTYSSEHYDACLALFDANCPEFFAPNERSEYAEFLRRVNGEYLVCLNGANVLAAFGVVDENIAHRRRLNWIMVSPEHHGVGMGTIIMQQTEQLVRKARASIIDISASHKSAAFFARFGAKKIKHIENGWGPKIHRIEMEWSLD